MRATLRLAALTLSLIAFGADVAVAQNQPGPPPQSRRLPSRHTSRNTKRQPRRTATILSDR